MSTIPEQALSAIRKRVLELAGTEDFATAKAFLEQHGGVEVAYVQLAADPGDQERAKIRADFAKRGILARIRIDRSLAGGARLFMGGMLKDASWRGRVRRILSAIYA
jgi:F0F1-type ATP synthase delta subunit